MESFYSEIGNELKNLTGGDIAIVSFEGKTLFSTFDVDEELKEAAVIAIKTKVRVSMLRDEGNTLIIPLSIRSKIEALILVGFIISEETFVNLLVKNVKCMESTTGVFSKGTPNVKKLFSHEELIETLKMFFDNDSSVMKTAIAMNIHRNTVLYILTKSKR
jgi:hypothetical protein